MKRLTTITLTGLTLTLAAPAALSQTDDSGNPEIRPYLGADLGYYRLDDEDFLDEDDRLKDNRTAGRVFAGVEANRIFGLQVGYLDFGETEDGRAKMEADGTTISGIAAIPLTETFAPFAKVGNLSWDRERSLGPLSSKDSGDDLFYGFGTRFTLTDHVDMKLQYERFAIDETDLDMASAGLQFNF